MRKHPSQVKDFARSAYAVGSPQVNGLRHIIWSFLSLVWLSGIPLFTLGQFIFLGYPDSPFLCIIQAKTPA